MAKLPFIFILFIFSATALSAPAPFADIHLHFNWDQKEIISAEETVRRLQANNVAIAVVSSTPSHLALELSSHDDLEIQAYFTPYITAAHRERWHRDKNVLIEAEKALQSGLYSGIGELHISADFGPRNDNKILLGLLKLAQKYRVPFLIHTEASSHQFFTPICQRHPEVRFLWAHAGGILPAGAVGRLMQQCPNVWSEVSVRDPWRYDTLVDENNQLLPGWRDLFIKFQDRFMTGTDPVWSVTRGQRWDQADEGWDYYDQLIEFHRSWLKQLPDDVEEKIRLTNAVSFLKRDLADEPD